MPPSSKTLPRVATLGRVVHVARCHGPGLSVASIIKNVGVAIEAGRNEVSPREPRLYSL